jgi:hypothetical protein
MFTEAAAGTVSSNHRILPPLQTHGPPLDGAAFVAAATEQMLGPGITLFPIQLGKTHSHLFDGYIVQSV